MGLPEIFLIAVGLAMDAFAVSITLGLSVQKPNVKELLLPGLYFGFFQALMPLAGYFAGILFADKIESFDHWIAFALLAVIGGKMILDSFSGDKADEEKSGGDSFQFVKMLVLAIATSIDALAIGITFAVLRIHIFTAILITGLVTFCIATIGVKIGNIFGAVFRSKAEFLGGLVLVGIGIKILVEHMLS